MKKVIGLIVLAIMVILPMSVNAKISIYIEPIEEQYTNTTMIGELIVEITGTDTLTQVPGQLQYNHVELTNIKVEDSSFTNNSVKNASGGYSLIFVPSETLTAGKYKVATLTFTKDGKATAEDKCYINFTPCVDEKGNYGCNNPSITIEEEYKCKIVDGIYYGKDGNEVTEEVYNEECIKNPQTGSFVPYIVIAAGIALAVSVFTISRKNNTLYKI